MTLTMIWLKTIRLFHSNTVIPNISIIKMLPQSVTFSMLDKVFSSILYSAMLIHFCPVSMQTIKR